MRRPVMQQEWQRRQTQRPVWALLGLLALVSTAGADIPLTALAAGIQVETAAVAEPGIQALAKAPQRSTRSRSSARYWQHLAPVHNNCSRVRLALHAESRPTVSSRAAYLRRFIRPPTV